MPELLSLVIQARAAVSRRNDLILENLLLRHQLRVAWRPKRRLSLRRQDRILWVLVRQLRRIGAATFYMSGRDGHSLAPKWLAIVLALEIENPTRTPAAAGSTTFPYRYDF